VPGVLFINALRVSLFQTKKKRLRIRQPRAVFSCNFLRGFVGARFGHRRAAACRIRPPRAMFKRKVVAPGALILK